VKTHLLAADDHLDYYQLSCLAIRTLHPGLLPVSPLVDCRPPAGLPRARSEDGYRLHRQVDVGSFSRSATFGRDFAVWCGLGALAAWVQD
jgi:hypothetical protein